MDNINLIVKPKLQKIMVYLFCNFGFTIKFILSI